MSKMAFFGIRSVTVAILVSLPIFSQAQYISGTHPYEQIDISDRNESVVSVGIPGSIRHGIAAAAGYGFDSGAMAADAMWSMERDILGKQIGFLGIEANLGVTHDFGDGSTDPFIEGCLYMLQWFCAGARHTFNEGTAFSFKTEVNLIRGYNSYLMYVGGDSPRLYSGVKIPVGHSSRVTRPTQAHRVLPQASDRTFQERLQQNKTWVERYAPRLIDEVGLGYLRQAIKEISLFLMPPIYSDNSHSLHQIKNIIAERPGAGLEDSEKLYYSSLDQVFSNAVEDTELGAELTNVARSMLYESVLVPFNFNFAQRKKPFTTRGFAEEALVRFGGHLEYLPITEIRKKAALEVYRRVLDEIEDEMQRLKDVWRDERGNPLNALNRGIRVWMPMNFALKKEEYDSEEEQKQILSQMTGRSFTDVNRITYIVDEAFFDEALTSIKSTLYYHVVMIHDFRDTNNNGDADPIAWQMVSEGYIDTFAESINDYIDGRRPVIPEFHLFLDEHFFRTNKAERIIEYIYNLAEDRAVDLKNPELQAMLDASQARLQDAIARLLTQPGWDQGRIKDVIKVHVNITNPAAQDFNIAMLRNDGVMVDHRKIFLKDIFEEYPEIGSAVFTGQGVGDHYAGRGWEDRAIKLEGVDLVHMKDEVRALFLSQGQKGIWPWSKDLHKEDVPYYFRTRTALQYPQSFAGLEERIETLKNNGFNATVSQLTNRTGYDQKNASVFKAAMYNMMVSGDLVVAPDSIWSSEFWMSMLLGASLRGSTVFAIMPATENAPADGAPTMAQMYKVVSSGFMASKILENEISHSGGALKVGLFNSQTHSQNILEKVQAMASRIGSEPELDRVFNFHPDAVSKLTTTINEFGSTYQADPRIDTDPDRTPKIHAKIHFFLSESARKIMALPEIADLLERYLWIRARQTSGDNAAFVALNRQNLLDDGTLLPAIAELKEGELTSSELDTYRVVLTGGSQNQNPRSLYMDGEVTISVMGEDGLIAIPDVVFIVYSSQFPKSVEEIGEYLHEPSDLMMFIVDHFGYLF